MSTSPSVSRTVRFGDVVRNVDETVRDPLACDLERFVGLEHIAPESLRIKRWGLIADGTSFTRKFSAGQVLFGKRRAYQRKVAVADFDGLCSSDILVFEPSDDRLLPELLPFIVQTEGFFQHALGTSAGSLSPRTRWRDLAAYEFSLPPLDEQRRIAEILWAAEEAIESFSVVFEQVASLTERLIEATLETNGSGAESSRVQLGDLLLDVQYGTSQKSCPPQPAAVPVLRIPNVFRGEIDLSDLAWVKLTPDEQRKYELGSGDLLVVRTNGNPDYVGRCAVVDTAPPKAVFASYLIRLRVREEKVHPTYLSAVFNSAVLRRTLRHEIRSSAGNFNLNAQGIRRQQIPLLSQDRQNELVSQLKVFNEAKATTDRHIAATQKLKAETLRNLLDT